MSAISLAEVLHLFLEIVLILLGKDSIKLEDDTESIDSGDDSGDIPNYSRDSENSISLEDSDDVTVPNAASRVTVTRGSFTVNVMRQNSGAVSISGVSIVISSRDFLQHGANCYVKYLF